ncbi:cell division protein FtsQ/DivIB [Marinomonas posidonica]|uniref:cell division protein FtsQ/DivIB n=1 Tax=Marinomonas posidonica TaxID=936476 RepID=UPI003735E9A3
MRLAAFIGAILLIVVASFQGEDSPDTWFAIEKIDIQGNLQNTSQVELQQEFSPLLGQSLLGLSVKEALAVVLSSPWVEKAEVRKVWPNTLQVIVHEYVPLAYWRDGQIISASAVVISPRVLPDLPLPILYGPVDSSDVVLEQFGLISQVLASTSLRIARLTLEPRGAWQIVFSNGLVVKLGRDDILERLQRFIAVYKSDLSGRIEQITSVDARYPHGVAVGWKKKN